MRGIFWVVGVALLAGGCGDSGTPSTQPSATEKLRAAGENLKEAAQIATQKAEPKVRAMGEEVREGIHQAAERVAERTATQPATAP